MILFVVLQNQYPIYFILFSDNNKENGTKTKEIERWTDKRHCELSDEIHGYVHIEQKSKVHEKQSSNKQWTSNHCFIRILLTFETIWNFRNMYLRSIIYNKKNGLHGIEKTVTLRDIFMQSIRHCEKESFLKNSLEI